MKHLGHAGLVMLGGIVGAVASAVVGFFVTLPIVVYLSNFGGQNNHVVGHDASSPIFYLFGFAGYFLVPFALFLSAMAALVWAFVGAMFFANLTGKFLDRA